MIIQSINPASGEVIAEHESTQLNSIPHVIEQSRQAQQQWGNLTIEKRLVHFQKLKQVLHDNVSHLLEVIELETGKLKTDGEAEVYDVIDAIDYYVNQLVDRESSSFIELNAQAYPETDLEISYVPHGVIGLIMPWNFSFYSPMMYAIAAIVVGNSVVLKPSEYATMVGLEMKKLFAKANFPEHLFHVLIGDEEVGKALVRSSVDKLFLVGSVAAGEHILKHAGIKPVQLELGGNSAAIVLQDADLDQAAQAIAWGGTYHSGQDCVGVKRIFVVEDSADELIKRLVKIVSSLRPGTDYGPYIRSHQLQTVMERIAVAVQGGAELLVGGEQLDRPGFWLAPSVIRYSDDELELVREETFGNVLPVRIVKDEEEAIYLANNTKYGLSNSVFTQDIDKAKKLARQLESGMVFINDPFVAIPGWDHWTGWKQSGFGTSESKLMQCLKKKVVSSNKQGLTRNFWYPYE